MEFFCLYKDFEFYLSMLYEEPLPRKHRFIYFIGKTILHNSLSLRLGRRSLQYVAECSDCTCQNYGGVSHADFQYVASVFFLAESVIQLIIKKQSPKKSIALILHAPQHRREASETPCLEDLQ